MRPVRVLYKRQVDNLASASRAEAEPPSTRRFVRRCKSGRGGDGGAPAQSRRKSRQRCGTIRGRRRWMAQIPAHHLRAGIGGMRSFRYVCPPPNPPHPTARCAIGPTARPHPPPSPRPLRSLLSSIFLGRIERARSRGIQPPLPNGGRVGSARGCHEFGICGTGGRERGEVPCHQCRRRVAVCGRQVHAQRHPITLTSKLMRRAPCPPQVFFPSARGRFPTRRGRRRAGSASWVASSRTFVVSLA